MAFLVCVLIAMTPRNVASSQESSGYELWQLRTVLIDVQHYDGQSFTGGNRGTGILIDASGSILTTRHIVGGDWQHYLDDALLWDKIRFFGRIGGGSNQPRSLRPIRVHGTEDALILRVADTETGEKFEHFLFGNVAKIPAESVDVAGYPVGTQRLQRSPQSTNLRSPCQPVQTTYCTLGTKLDLGFSGSPVIWGDGETAVGMVVSSAVEGEAKFLPLRLISAWTGEVAEPTFVTELSAGVRQPTAKGRTWLEPTINRIGGSINDTTLCGPMSRCEVRFAVSNPNDEPVTLYSIYLRQGQASDQSFALQTATVSIVNTDIDLGDVSLVNGPSIERVNNNDLHIVPGKNTAVFKLGIDASLYKSRGDYSNALKTKDAMSRAAILESVGDVRLIATFLDGVSFDPVHVELLVWKMPQENKHQSSFYFE